MVVAESEDVEQAVVLVYIILHHLRIGNACYDKYLARVLDFARLTRREINQLSVAIGRIEDRLLEGGWQIGRDFGFLFSAQGTGALGHNHDIGTGDIAGRFAQPACGKHHVLV